MEIFNLGNKRNIKMTRRGRRGDGIFSAALPLRQQVLGDAHLQHLQALCSINIVAPKGVNKTRFQKQVMFHSNSLSR